MSARKRPAIEKLVALSWADIVALSNKAGSDPEEYTLKFLESLYVVNATNLNFLYQKELVSHIGTKGIAPAGDFITKWAKGDHVLYTVFEQRKNKDGVDWLYPVAVAAFCDLDFTNRMGELKFVIRPNLYGRGYTRLVANKLLDVAFNKLLMNNVVIKILKDNKTYMTYNSLLKLPGCRRVGIMMSCIEADKQVKSMYIFQCSNEFYNRDKEEEKK